jgi:DNA-binding transcriptional ArsR family regulator
MAGRPDPLSRYEVTDVAVLRLLAHPLRARILGLLRLEGEATASTLGRRLGESSGSTSYHLRQLARVGLIEESPQQSSRRERVWRAAQALTSIDPRRFSGPDEHGVLDEFSRLQLRRLDAQSERWLGRRAEAPGDWDAAGGFSDSVVRLTPDAALELSERVGALLRELEQRSAADPSAAWVSVFWALLPQLDEDLA